MFMNTLTLDGGQAVYPELAGARVVVTGLTPSAGVDLARAFAEHKSSLVVQSASDAPEIVELAALLAQSAADIKLFTSPIATDADAVDFAKTAAQAFGGLDAAINIISVTRVELRRLASEDDIAAFVSTKLGPALEITRVAANRMRLTLGTGLVLNILVTEPELSRSEAALVGMIRAALAAITRREAEAWAGQAIRINAIAPRMSLPGDAPSGACLSGEADIAALALFLASKKGRTHTSHVFDAEGVAGLGC